MTVLNGIGVRIARSKNKLRFRYLNQGAVVECEDPRVIAALRRLTDDSDLFVFEELSDV